MVKTYGYNFRCTYMTNQIQHLNDVILTPETPENEWLIIDQSESRILMLLSLEPYMEGSADYISRLESSRMIRRWEAHV